MKHFTSNADYMNYYHAAIAEYYKSIGQPIPAFAAFFNDPLDEYIDAKLTADGYDAANPVIEPDLSDAGIVKIPYIGEGRTWADVARSNGIKILSERALSINMLYDPMEYSYVSPNTGSVVWVYVHTLSSPESDLDVGVYAQRQLTDDEAMFALSADRH